VTRPSGKPTGPGTSSTNDVADPHPSDEEHYDLIKSPGGAKTPKGKEVGIELGRHDGKPRRRPRNAETD
jgi:hypothetical protein